MASAEARAAYAVNYCAAQDFKMPPNSSDHSSSAPIILESDWAPSNSVQDHINLGCMPPNNPNSEKLQDKKWGPNVETNIDEAIYTSVHMNSWEAELGAFCGGVVDDNVQVGEDQSIENLNDLSCFGSADSADTRMPKIEAALNDDLQLTPKKGIKRSSGFFMIILWT